MKLTGEEQGMLDGRKGPTMQKVMRTLVLYGDALGAERFADIEGGGHVVAVYPVPGIGLSLDMADELVEAGLRARYPFSACPRAPLDFENLRLTPEQERVFEEMYREQPHCDAGLLGTGLRDSECYTCTPYYDEVGNAPRPGAVVAWAASECVFYANSVLGARTNRNAAMIELLSNIAGKTPLFGLLTDEGRRATWLVDVRTTRLPNPQLLGAAIAERVLDGVPYVTGLDRFLGPGLPDETLDYLKELGTACGTIGAIGLCHVEAMTPEAVQQGRDLLLPDHQYVAIGDQDLEELMASYPVNWVDKDASPQKCIIGCPHQSYRQLRWWASRIQDALRASGRIRLQVPTIICAAPGVIRRFQADGEAYERMRCAGVTLSPTCAEAYMDNPMCAREAVITNSNKTRTYTTARFLLDEDLLQTIVTGRIAERCTI